MTRRAGVARRALTAAAAALLSAVVVAAGAAPASADAPPRFRPPRQFYLSLGDSLAFGFQQAKLQALLRAGAYSPDAFDTGYTDVFAARMREIRPDVQVVNLSCPGETTVTMIVGGCPFPLPLHETYTGPQLDAAATFLREHGGHVSPVTVSIGANDAIALFRRCGLVQQCIEAALPALAAQLRANLDAILSRLDEARGSTEVIVLRPYNPFAVVAPSTDAAAIRLGDVLSQVAAAHRARVADAFTPINLAAPQPQTLCTLTLFCTVPPDVHASDSGYAVIASAFFAASGYGRLEEE